LTSFQANIITEHFSIHIQCCARFLLFVINSYERPGKGEEGEKKGKKKKKKKKKERRRRIRRKRMASIITAV